MFRSTAVPTALIELYGIREIQRGDTKALDDQFDRGVVCGSK